MNIIDRLQNKSAKEPLLPPPGELDFTLEPKEIFGLRRNDHHALAADRIREQFGLNGPAIVVLRVGEGGQLYYVIDVGDDSSQPNRDEDPSSLRSIVVAQARGSDSEHTVVPAGHIVQFGDPKAPEFAIAVGLGGDTTVQAYTDSVEVLAG